CGIFVGGWSRGGNKHTNPYREPSSGVFGEKVAGFLPQRAFAARRPPSPCCRESLQQEGRRLLVAERPCRRKVAFSLLQRAFAARRPDSSCSSGRLLRLVVYRDGKHARIQGPNRSTP